MSYQAQNVALARSRGQVPSIHYRVLMEPIGTNVFFLAPWARIVSGAYRALAVDWGGAVYDLDAQRALTRYEADSRRHRTATCPTAGRRTELSRTICGTVS